MKLSTRLNGQRFGRRVVAKDSGLRQKDGKSTSILWEYVCDCGKAGRTTSDNLRSRESCGCLRIEKLKESLQGKPSLNWKGGVKNKGSVAWANNRLSALRMAAQADGHAEPVGDSEHVIKLYQECDGHCACCGVPEIECSRSLVLDHCHRTGQLRGFLCAKCNSAIGMLQDDSEICRAAAAYLDNAGSILEGGRTDGSTQLTAGGR